MAPDVPPASLADELPRGMNEQALREAVEYSGYPLQTVAAGLLVDRGCRVEEEWAWRDEETGTERTLDVLGHIPGTAHRTDAGSLLVVAALLIECKQSRNPYLGFAAAAPPNLVRHPSILGLRSARLEVRPDDGASWFVEAGINDALGMTRHRYSTTPTIVSSLSRAHPKGDRVEISGDEAFNAVVRPLAKASRSYRQQWQEQNRGRSDSYVARLIFPIALIDAPLLLVRGRPGKSDIEPAKWLRLIGRRPVTTKARAWDRLGFDVIDLVSADFFETFLHEYLAPFVDAFRKSVASVQDVVLSGKGIVDGLERGQSLPDDLAERLRPMRTQP